MNNLEIDMNFKNLIIQCCSSKTNFEKNQDEIFQQIQTDSKKMSQVIEVCKEIIKTGQQNDSLFYALFLVKMITANYQNEQTIQKVSKILGQRLYAMLYKMKNKSDWKECGNIYKINAQQFDTQYKWGLKFYVLGLECIQFWSMIGDAEFNKHWISLEQQVPQPPFDKIGNYYYCKIDEVDQIHQKLEKQLNNNTEQQNFEQQEENIQQEFMIFESIFDEIDRKGNIYLNTLYSNEDSIIIDEKQKIFLNEMNQNGSIIEQKVEGIFNTIQQQKQEDQNKIEEIAQKFILYQSLKDYLQQKNIHSQNKITKTRKDIRNMIYKDQLQVFFPQIEYNENKSLDQKPIQNIDEFNYDIEDDKDYIQNNIQKDLKLDYLNDVNELSSVKKENFHNQSNNPLNRLKMVSSEIETPQNNNNKKIDFENNNLKKKKQQLEEELKRLEQREKKLKVNSSTVSQKQSRKIGSKAIINEIQRKNREYEELKSKYNTLLNEFNTKVQMDSSKMQFENERLKSSINESLMNISRMRQQKQSGYQNNQQSYFKDYTQSRYIPKEYLYESKYSQNPIYQSNNFQKQGMNNSKYFQII